MRYNDSCCTVDVERKTIDDKWMNCITVSNAHKRHNLTDPVVVFHTEAVELNSHNIGQLFRDQFTKVFHYSTPNEDWLPNTVDVQRMVVGESM
jgi:hypothetical protein